MLHHTSIKVVIMSRLEGLYEWSFNDGRVLGFFIHLNCETNDP